MTKYKYIKSITCLLLLLFVLFIKKETAFAYQDYGNSWSICSHESWKFMSNGSFNIQFLGENASGGFTDNLGTSTVNVSGLSGTQYYYADYPGAIYFSVANPVNGLRLGNSSSGLFVYDMCSDCGSPYFQGFSVPFYYTAPTFYNGGVTSSSSDGVLTTNGRTVYGNYRWPYKNYLYTNYQFQGSSTLTNNYFVANGTTVHDLGVQIKPLSGAEYNYGSKTLTIRLQRTSYGLTIYPGVGTWNGKTGIVNSAVEPSLVQKWGTKKTIVNPTANSYTVTLNANGGSGSTTITAARPFSGWTHSGVGTLSGITFTYGQGGSSLIANYSTNAVTLPTLSRSGWTHLGWSTNQNAMSATYANGSSYTPSGNVTLYAIWKENLGVKAEITRLLAPHFPIFKMGETGILTIHTTGYAEKVIVDFTSNLFPDKEYNTEYILDSTKESSELKNTFIIPLYCNEGRYTATVTAYRNGQIADAYPSLEVKGTILDEIRTRIRKN